MCLICETSVKHLCRCGWHRLDAGEYFKAHDPAQYEEFTLASPWVPCGFGLAAEPPIFYSDDSDDESITGQMQVDQTPTFGHVLPGWTLVGRNGKHK